MPRSQPPGTDTCAAGGYVVTAFSGTTHLPPGKIKSIAISVRKVGRSKIECCLELGDNIDRSGTTIKIIIITRPADGR